MICRHNLRMTKKSGFGHAMMLLIAMAVSPTALTQVQTCGGGTCGMEDRGNPAPSTSNSNRSQPSSAAPTSNRNAALGGAAALFEGLGNALSGRSSAQNGGETDDDDSDGADAVATKHAADAQKSLSNDPSLNPFGNPAPGPLISNSGSGGPSSSQTTNSQPLDPDADYDGKPCRYFTRGNDQAHLNYYSNNAMSIYGGRVYKCVSGVWRYLEPSSVLGDADQQRLEASKQESSSVNTDTLESD
jgi:hypothetical protein